MEKKKPDSELKLKVAEAIQDDVNKGIVRIDNNFMQEAGIRVGDIVEIEDGRKTVAITDRAYPGDIGLNIIRMDGIVRRNANGTKYSGIAAAKIEIPRSITVSPKYIGLQSGKNKMCEQ